LDPGIAPELPPKTERDVVVPLTEEQISLYRATTTEVLADIADNDGITRHGLVLKLLTALKQITNHPAHYLDQRGPLPGRSGKLTALDEIVDAALDEGEPILVFTQYVVMGELLAEHLSSRGIDSGFLHGGLSVAGRSALVDRFQAGSLPVLLLSLRAGGTGLNLTAASHVVHYDRWWNPAVEDQATDRAHRIGQTKPVTVHRLITEGTVEDRVAELLEQKRALADRVVGVGDAWLSGLDDDELRSLIMLESSESAAASEGAR
jgi:SNF2 family DNA or RNA helicase